MTSLERLADFAATAPDWFRNAVDEYLAGRVETLDDALGLSRLERRARALARRDRHLRRAWALVDVDRPGSTARAEALLEAIDRYRRASLTSSPSDLRREIEDALATGIEMPGSVKQVLRICGRTSAGVLMSVWK